MWVGGSTKIIEKRNSNCDVGDHKHPLPVNALFVLTAISRST